MVRALMRRLLVIAALALVSACKQQEGEPCEHEDECGEGLRCECLDLPTTRGRCVPEGDEPICQEPDAGPLPDAGPFDAGPDAGPFDAGPPDAGPVDAGMIDAGMMSMMDAGRDAGMIDAGMPP